MTIFKKPKKEPVRLHKVENQNKSEWHKFVITTSVIIGLVLLLLLFLLICMMIVPKTYGFFWW